MLLLQEIEVLRVTGGTGYKNGTTIHLLMEMVLMVAKIVVSEVLYNL